MKKNPELLAYCGLYCGACSFKAAYDKNLREHIMTLPSQYDEYKDKPLQFCPGCRMDPGGADCEIRNCARDKSVDHCGVCDDFVCDKIADFCSDGVPHHSEILSNLYTVREIGEDAWLERQRSKWTCECGATISWYLRKCVQCDKSIH
ncbi:MAG: DUF3795 domain-containing protein [candidate division WOR-3 bacterium]|nr:MAG: DUF3795 domain-containing protein [candidate division WOR-3 bacterium]